MPELEELTLWPEAFHVSHSVKPGSEEAQKMTVTSGLKCYELSKLCAPPGFWAKMLLTSPIWASTTHLMTWRLRVTSRRQHSIFRLWPLTYKRWNGISGLFPRATASDCKGTSKNRFRGSGLERGNLREVTRESKEDPIWLNPEFVEYVKGFPIGWTELEPSETP